jgi:hypothetical protein
MKFNDVDACMEKAISERRRCDELVDIPDLVLKNLILAYEWHKQRHEQS